MSESSLKPFNGKLDENTGSQQQASLKPFEGDIDGEKQNKGIKGHLQDAGLAALKGAIAVPEIAVGIMDTMSDGAVGKTLENKNGAIGFRPREAKQALSDLHTDQYKAQQQEFADAGKDGDWADKVVDKTKVALTNPSLIANTVVESVPSMLAGGVLGRASGIANPVVAGAVGEGAVMAGSQAEQIRQETVDGRLTADQSLAGATTGVLGGLIGFAGGRIAQKLGIGDVDTMLVNGKLGPAEIAGEIAAMPAKSLPRRVVEGAISEGFLEELPQSVSEQILQNLALDKPWSDGIEDAAVMGTLAGMAMGGAANILSGHSTGTEPHDTQQQSGIPDPPSAPPQLGLSPDNALSGEYIPRENVPQGDNQGRTAFVYDQPSMEADNLLSNNYEGDADFNTSGNLDPSNNPLSPSGGNYFEDYSTQPQLPSEHLGINPNDGPMSSAAALAVDSGASQMLNMPQNDAKNEGPLSGAVPSEYQSLLASNNKNTPVVTNGLDRTSQLNDGDVSQSAITEQNKGIENLETAPSNLSVVMGVQSKVTELETQLANEKSVIKKVRLRKQIAELQKDNPIDQAAHAAATSIQNDLPEPSQAQIEAGNYKKGHIKVHGLDIAVENPRGSERRGTDPDGKEWAHTMSDHYGYIKRTTGADNENIDTYVGNSPESEQVFIVDQIDQKTGGFDEHKVMMGFNSKEDAVQAYSSNFDKGWKVGAVRALNKDEFKSWLKDGDTKKPAGESAAPQSETTLDPQRVQRDYGDNLESVMSDVETLVDDFTIDLHSVPKKRNALKNPNYHAVKHENGRVEILGMKHPATGKWVGKEPTQDKTLAHDSPAPAELQKRDLKSNFPENPDSSKPVATKPKEVIQDFGEKIGGARKDTAVKTGKKIVAEKTKDDRPTWAKRFVISEVAASSNPAEVGKWTISDNKNKDWMGNNRRLTNQIFNTQKEAESFLPVAAVAMKHRVTTDTKDGKKGYIIVRTVSDRKHVQVVQQLFDTREGANEYLVRHAQEILETNTTFGELDLPRPENTQRTGVTRREGDAKDSDFSRVFGFRGVEFGNWNNQVERQELLNDAFDGLMDLAEVLNIPPEALSLNGELALAFGARGQGLSSAKAHYESNRVVINLTKMNGAGSLAHEWWHAFDHYLSRQDGSASSAWIQHEDGSRSLNAKSNPADRFASHGFKVVKSGVREDVRNNFEKLMVTLFRRSQAYIEDTKTADEFVARSRDEVQDKLNSIRENLAKQLDPKYYKRFNKPASTEQLAEFDTAAELIITGQLLETEARKNPKSRSTFGGYRHTNDALDKINEIFKAVRGRSGFNADFKGVLDYLRGSMSRYMGRLKLLADAQQSTTKHKSVPTEFAMNAKELDQGRGSDYWTTPHEMSARAFQGYVEDKISAKNARSPFLNYGPENVGIITPYGVKRPFPYGEERVAINQAFDDLISGLKTEQTDSGKRLYSRKSNNKKDSVTVNGVRQILIDRFGEDTIAELERQGKLEIIQDYQVEGVEGFYYNGKAVLVASNLTAESTVPTFLHELGGHAGFQNMMNQKQYNELMNQFNKLVEQGNPVALAAKMLAEREQGSERQQLEYLPYLLTLSSTMQQRNVIQRNALQKLINNIVSYVKAWVFDNFGINLNLNPDDILALSERMIGQIKHQSSLDLIRQKYHGTSQWMTAPNGAKTHLSEQQWLQVRTPEFKKWFGDWENDAANASQVLDENGEPKVVYHGTATEFNEFTQGHGLLGDGIYLTDSFDTADMYANIRGNNGFVMPLFVNIRNAFKTTGNVSRDKVVEATKSGKYQGVVHQFENQEYIVALEPNQVKIAVGNTGTFNSESSDIRFSRSSNYEDITNRISKGFKNLPKTGDLINKAGDLINKKGVDWLSIGLGLLSRRHLTEVYGKLLPQLNKYNELAAQMDADKNDIAAEADNIVREWSKLKDEDALANVMHDATLAQIDPAKPYQQGDNKVKYQQLHHAYINLSPEAQAMYKKARNAYSGHYAKVREAIRERILRSALNSQKKADLLKNIEGSFGQIKGVYFPLARFGKYVVVMRNQNGQAEVISRAETMNEAESIRSELMKKYPHYNSDDVKKDAEFSASRDSVGRGFMSDLFDEVGNLGLDKKAQADFEDTLSQLYLSSMPDLSWAKHGIHRKGTAGFSQDARRAFAQHMFSGANYLGKLRYGDQLTQQLDEMKKYSNEQFKKAIGYDQRSAQSVIDEMEKRHELLMNPKGNPISSFLTSVGFMYYMGLSPAAAMVNLSQTALIAYPLMGAKWNYDKAGKELLNASKDFAKGIEFKVPDFSNLESFKKSIGDVYSPNIDKVIKGLELDAYNEAVKRGVIDVTQAHDLAGIAQGEDSKVMWYFRPAMRLASGMFHHAERFNREVTFIAAYRLASQAGASQTEAFEQAMDMVYRGHFDYSAGNRARFMQGNLAKVVLLFKQYAQNMIYTLVRNAHQSIYALDPKDQREARRALAGILGMHALAAGAIGLPITGMLATASLLIAKKSKLGAVAFGVAALAALASGGDDDDPYELEIVIRNWLSDIHPKFADLVFGGVPRAFSPVDLSGRVGLNNLIIPDVQDGLEGADWAKAMQSALLGPVVGISTNAVKGMQEINNGDYGRGIETMLPVVLKNAMKSMRFANEGVLTRNKDVIQEEVGTVGLFSQAIGFSPSDVKTSMEGRSAIYDYKTKLENHRKDLMRQWVVAKRDDDSEGMDKAWAEILKFNENVSEKNPSMRIKRINLMQSYKSNERRSKYTGDGGVYLTKRQKGAEEQGGFAFKH